MNEPKWSPDEALKVRYVGEEKVVDLRDLDGEVFRDGTKELRTQRVELCLDEIERALGLDTTNEAGESALRKVQRAISTIEGWRVR